MNNLALIFNSQSKYKIIKKNVSADNKAEDENAKFWAFRHIQKSKQFQTAWQSEQEEDI